MHLAVYPGGVLRRRRFHAELSGPPGQLHRSQPACDAAHIVPEWYFLPFYAILRAFTADVWVGRRFASLHDRRHHRRQVLWRAGDVRCDRWSWRWCRGWTPPRVRSGRYRPMFKWWFAVLLVIDFIVLMWCGAMPAEGIYPHHRSHRRGLLVRLLPRDPAAARRDREAADLQPETIEADFARALSAKPTGKARDAAQQPAE